MKKQSFMLFTAILISFSLSLRTSVLYERSNPLFCTFGVLPAFAQSEDELVFSMSRDFGYASISGGDIQGTFTMKVSGPDDLTKVIFYVDDQSIGEDTEPPFKLQFNTDSFPLGAHTLSASGLTASGKELKTKVYQRNFVTADEGWKAAMKIAGPVLILVFGISLISIVGPVVMGRGKKNRLPLGAPRSYGVAGGAICSRCHRPFSINFLGPNLIVGKLDRCPYCGKWGVVRRSSPVQLKAAEAAELASASGDAQQVTGLTEEEKLQKDLDDSRFQGM
jgi:hypothetical protein